MKFITVRATKSPAEERIQKVFNKLPLKVYREVKFDEAELVFDFFIPAFNTVIEYNGKQV